ncbi:hypothetical protein GCM10009100_25540 [Thalassospira tepidiphila]
MQICVFKFLQISAETYTNVPICKKKNYPEESLLVGNARDCMESGFSRAAGEVVTYARWSLAPLVYERSRLTAVRERCNEILK